MKADYSTESRQSISSLSGVKAYQTGKSVVSVSTILYTVDLYTVIAIDFGSHWHSYDYRYLTLPLLVPVRRDIE